MKRATAIICAAAICAAGTPFYGCAPQESEGTKYRITAAYDGGNTLEGRVETDFYNDTGNALDCLKFNLWGNAFREGAASSPVSEAAKADTYYGGESYGGMEITAVTGGEAQTGGDDMNILCITPAEPIYPEQRLTVSIEFVLKLANVNARTGVAEGAVNLGNFYPVLCAYGGSGWLEYAYCPTGDPFVSQTADYEVELTVPEEFLVAASGEQTEVSRAADCATYKFELSGARDFAAVLSRQFEVVTRQAGDVRIKCYCLNESGRALADIAAESLAYFEEAFGRYPYPEFSIVQTGLAQSGMEYPALAMISADCGDAVYTAVHEVAHQWWYAAVGSDQYMHAWQDEGLAEYSALMFFESHPEYGFTRAGLISTATRAYRAYFSVYSQLFDGADTGMDRALCDFSGDYEYANIAYNKALIMFEALREALGDGQFRAALQSYYSSYSASIAPPEGLMAAFCARADCEGIFESFIQGKVII